jgi:hypothetical protein
MFTRRPLRLVAFALIICLAGWIGSPALGQRNVTSPKEQFGFNIGDDYHLANYQQLTAYWQKLDRESDRVKVVSIGQTEEGRPQWMAVVSSPANLRRADHYRDITRRLALAEGLTDARARELARQGRVIVWISGGLHASETLVAQQLIETVYQLASRNDAETRRILDQVIVLAVLANPDGMDLVADWYMREPDPKKRVAGNYPRLYQKYIGHDNNRDFYAVTQAETKNMCRVLFREWFPQIVYDHHQSGPPGTVMFAPPFRDPFNYRIDPRVISGIDALGAAMMNRFLAEGKPGVTVRSGARYSTWWNGGLRSITYYHNMIGLLTETIGSPTPITIPFDPRLQLPRGDLPAPIEPQPWPFRNSVEYSLTANYAVLDYAARHREQLLWNAYALGRDAIAAGSRDSWTPSPTQMARAQAELKKRADAEKKAAQAKAKSKAKSSAKSSTTQKAAPKADSRQDFTRFFRDPKERNPRGYIVPADQDDFGTATRFINTLIENGIRVLRATNAFAHAGRAYPAGSFLVPCNQAFRAHVLDMFEPQDHPNDLQYPGGPPIPPYDIAGWTLAMQMAVQFDRAWDEVRGPFAEVRDVLRPPPGKVINTQTAAGFYLRADANDAYRAVNRLHVIGDPVQRLTGAVTNAAGVFAPGTFYLPARAHTLAQLHLLAADTGVTFIGGPAPPPEQLAILRKPRVGLWDRYGGSMPSGWTRWILERFEFPFEVVFPPRLDAGRLREQFDVLIFVTGAIPARNTNAPAGATSGDSGESASASSGGSGGSLSEANLPPEYRGRRGSITARTTIPQLREFIAAGGVVLTIGSSTQLAEHLGLPLENHLVEPAKAARNDEDKDQDKDEGKDGAKPAKPKPLPREKFYIPGSLVRARVDTTHPLAWGMSERADFMFQASPVFRLAPPKPETPVDEGTGGNGDQHPPSAPAAAPDLTLVTRVAWYDEKAPLRSGWALGQEYLQDGWAVVEAKLGAGSVALFGPEIAFRAQPHGTFKLLFNGILNAGMRTP